MCFVADVHFALNPSDGILTAIWRGEEKKDGSSGKHAAVWMRLSVFTEFVFYCSRPTVAVSCARQPWAASVFLFKKKKKERERCAWSGPKQQFEPSVRYMLFKIKAWHHFQLHDVIPLSRWSLLASLLFFNLWGLYHPELRLRLHTPQQPLLHVWNYK